MSDRIELVLDTNIILDCFVFTDPWVKPLVAALDEGRASAITRTDCLDELRRVLTYPKLRLASPQQDLVFERYGALVQTYAGPISELRLPRCTDTDDQKFLELARDAKAHYLVSKDKRVLSLGRRRAAPLPFQIVNPAGLIAALTPATTA